MYWMAAPEAMLSTENPAMTFFMEEMIMTTTFLLAAAEMIS